MNLKQNIMIDAAELIDNDFLRQFELKVDDNLAKIEYSLQDRKIFLTKLIPSGAYPIRRQLRVLTYQALID